MAAESRQPMFLVITTILTVAMLGGALWGLFFMVRAVGSGFLTLPKEVAAAIVAASTTILVSVGSMMISKSLDRRREIEQAQRPTKVQIYTELMNFFFRVMFSEAAGEKSPSEEEKVRFFRDFTEKIIIWGSANVVKEYAAFRSDLATGHNESTILRFEKLLLAAREDLGHQGGEFSEGQLIGTFVNDIDKVLSQKRQGKLQSSR